MQTQKKKKKKQNKIKKINQSAISELLLTILNFAEFFLYSVS